MMPRFQVELSSFGMSSKFDKVRRVKAIRC